VAGLCLESQLETRFRFESRAFATNVFVCNTREMEGYYVENIAVDMEGLCMNFVHCWKVRVSEI